MIRCATFVAAGVVLLSLAGCLITESLRER
jgi:hypothetical protein